MGIKVYTYIVYIYIIFFSVILRALHFFSEALYERFLVGESFQFQVSEIHYFVEKSLRQI